MSIRAERPYEEDAKEFLENARHMELQRLEAAAKQFLRDTGVGSIADHMSVHAWMAAFAYTELSKQRRQANFKNWREHDIQETEFGGDL